MRCWPLVQFAWSDLVVDWSAYGNRRRGVPAAMRRGRATAAQVLAVRAVRADTMGAVTPGREPRTRLLFRLGALVATTAGLLWVVYGLWAGMSTGGHWASRAAACSSPVFLRGWPSGGTAWAGRARSS